ncbi:MAG: helix-turn-helix domain-containing protein, partial [Muribaculaceae bacterium]|nr:helix-turn-helix domain-containing protein [Muribaculaceae bacterium]
MIKDELEYRGITQKALAAEIGIPASVLNEILNGKRAVT